MEDHNQPLDEGLNSNQSSSPGLQITARIRQFWRESTQWALFFAILGFLYLALLVFTLLQGASSGAAGVAGGLFVILFAGAFIFFPTWFMFQFSQKLKLGLREENNTAAEAAFRNLRRLYQFAGVLLIILLSIYAIAFLFLLLMMGRNM
ncbi:MAG: hypothetical protein IPH12_08175 [Saprospirales bacterium]|jgi:hypothetical protein|nr:hypothetical protein [Saprospirales bacterium]MBK8920806.1 hypothetical protein [Saprospirales bacterium]